MIADDQLKRLLRINYTMANFKPCFGRLRRYIIAFVVSLAAATPASASMVSCLDIDGNGLTDEFDAVLATRYVSGVRSAALVAGALGAGATRTTSEAISAFIQERDLDLDGNGVVDLNDALLIRRVISGASGPALTSGILGANAARQSPATIIAHVTGESGCVLPALGIKAIGFSGTRGSVIDVLPGQVVNHRPNLVFAEGINPSVINLTLPAVYTQIAIETDSSGRQFLRVSGDGLTAGTELPFVLRVANTATLRSVDVSFSVRVVSANATVQSTVDSSGGATNVPGVGMISIASNSLVTPATVTVRTAPSTANAEDDVVAIAFDRSVAGAGLSLSLPSLAPIEPPRPAAGGLRSSVSAGAQIAKAIPYQSDRGSLGYKWRSFRGYKLIVGGYRLPSETAISVADLEVAGSYGTVQVPGSTNTATTLSFMVTTTAVLTSSADFADVTATNVALSGDDPVLFVHGFQADLDGALGGGRGTWHLFPQLLHDSSAFGGRKLLPFEFRWNTNADFRDAAVDLAYAIGLIKQRTGKPVHVIAHSFGGVLVRTLLQGLSRGYPTGSTAASFARDAIASLTTLGAPHSGISRANQSIGGADLPAGQDSYFFFGCLQVSCHVMGEETLGGGSFLETRVRAMLGLSQSPGEHAARLFASRQQLPAIPIRVGLGLTAYRGSTTDWDAGDTLISYLGQRFLPSQTAPATLLNETPVGQASVTEVVLGSNRDARPGDTLNAYELAQLRSSGYKHTGGNDTGTVGSEPGPDTQCSVGATCTHAGYAMVKQLLAYPAVQGTFLVQAGDSYGTVWESPVGQNTCTFAAGGTWSAGPLGPSFSPDGVTPLESANASFAFPGQNPFKLIARDMVNPGLLSVGSGGSFTLEGRRTFRFLMNDAVGGYYDNTGAITVGFSCAPVTTAVYVHAADDAGVAVRNNASVTRNCSLAASGLWGETQFTQLVGPTGRAGEYYGLTPLPSAQTYSLIGLVPPRLQPTLGAIALIGNGRAIDLEPGETLTFWINDTRGAWYNNVGSMNVTLGCDGSLNP